MANRGFHQDTSMDLCILLWVHLWIYTFFCGGLVVLAQDCPIIPDEETYLNDQS
jgi:hypothetical protein